jgi:hypothetical protein
MRNTTMESRGLFCHPAWYNISEHNQTYRIRSGNWRIRPCLCGDVDAFCMDLKRAAYAHQTAARATVISTLAGHAEGALNLGGSGGKLPREIFG